MFEAYVGRSGSKYTVKDLDGRSIHNRNFRNCFFLADAVEEIHKSSVIRRPGPPSKWILESKFQQLPRHTYQNENLLAGLYHPISAASCDEKIKLRVKGRVGLVSPRSRLWEPGLRLLQFSGMEVQRDGHRLGIISEAAKSKVSIATTGRSRAVPHSPGSFPHAKESWRTAAHVVKDQF